MRPERLSAAALAIALAAVGGAAHATPFAIRTAGADTAIAIDLGSITRFRSYRIAWTYEFFRSGAGLMSKRMQIMATREMVDCRTRQNIDLQTVRYMADGAELSRIGREAHWKISLRGSNSDYLVGVICDGVDPAWKASRVPTVFDLYRATWRR